MSLNIKNADVVRLVRELARVREVDMTEAVRHAVERELASHRKQVERRLRAMKAVEARIAQLPVFDNRPSDQILGDLYDENGLPG